MRLGLHLRLHLHPDALRDTDLFRVEGVSPDEVPGCAEESVRDQLLVPELKRRKLNVEDPGDARKYPDLSVFRKACDPLKSAFDVKSRTIVRWDDGLPYVRLNDLGGLIGGAS